jgi:hypothetical protein
MLVLVQLLLEPYVQSICRRAGVLNSSEQRLSLKRLESFDTTCAVSYNRISYDRLLMNLHSPYSLLKVYTNHRIQKTFARSKSNPVLKEYLYSNQNDLLSSLRRRGQSESKKNVFCNASLVSLERALTISFHVKPTKTYCWCSFSYENKKTIQKRQWLRLEGI